MNRPTRPNYQGIGAPLRRVEDRRFLLGRGRFVADIELPGALHCVLVRSPHAHARIRKIDTAAAAAAPGVVAVFTGSDMAADGVLPMRPLWVIRSRDGSEMAQPPRYALARGTVRHVGEPVVAVIAETREAAADAAERVAIDYETLAAVVRRARGAGSRRAAAARGRARQRLLPLGARRRGGGARGAQGGAAQGRDRSRQQPPRRRGARAARRVRHRRARHRQAHAGERDAGAAPHPQAGHRAARHPRERAAGDLARRRRRLRLQGQALSRGVARGLGGAAALPPGALGRDAGGELPVRQPGARSLHPCRARARRRRPLPRAARRDLRRARRLPLDLRRQHSERDLHARCSPAAIARRRSSWR